MTDATPFITSPARPMNPLPARRPHLSELASTTYQESLDEWTNMECDAPAYEPEFSDDEMAAAEAYAYDRESAMAERQEEFLREQDLW